MGELEVYEGSNRQLLDEIISKRRMVKGQLRPIIEGITKRIEGTGMTTKTILDYNLVDSIKLVINKCQFQHSADISIKCRAHLNDDHVKLMSALDFSDNSSLVCFMRITIANAIGAYKYREDYLKLCAYVYLVRGNDTQPSYQGIAELLTLCIAGDNFMSYNNFDDGEVEQEVVANDNGFYLIGKSCGGVIQDDVKPFLTSREVDRIPALVQLWVDQEEVNKCVEEATTLLLNTDDNCELPPVIGCYRQLCQLDWRYIYPLHNVLKSIIDPEIDRDSIECYANSLIELVYSDDQPRGQTVLQGDILKALYESLKERFEK